MNDNYYNESSNPGAFVATTNVWDVQQLYSVDINSTEFKELLVRLYQNINNIALSINIKDSGYYSTEEFLNGQLFFPNPYQLLDPLENPEYRQVFRMTVNFGTLPNAGTISVPHGIIVTSGFTFTRIYGSATNSAVNSFIPLPYSSSTLNKNIELNADNINVNITTAIDYSSYINTYVVLEYLKN